MTPGQPAPSRSAPSRPAPRRPAPRRPAPSPSTVPGPAALARLGTRLAALALAPLVALSAGSAAGQSEAWRYEPVEGGGLALSCRPGRERACAIAFCGADGRLGLGLTGWEAAGGRDRHEAFAAVDGSGRTGTLTRGDTRLDGETLWQLELDGTRTEAALERLRRGSEFRIEAGRGGEPFVFGLDGSSRAIGQLQARCARIAAGDPAPGPDGGGERSAEEIIGGIAIGVLEELLSERAGEDVPGPVARGDDRYDDDDFDDRYDDDVDDDRRADDRFRDRLPGARGRDRRPAWPDFEIETRRATSVVASLGRGREVLVVPLRTRVGRLWVERREPWRTDIRRITAVYAEGTRRELGLGTWRGRADGRLILPDGDLMRLEIEGRAAGDGAGRAEILVTAAPPGVVPPRYDRPAVAPARWVPFGERRVSRGTDRDRIRVGAEAGRFDAVGMTVDGRAVAVDSIVVDYANGRSERLEVRETLRDGERLVLELRGRQPRVIERLVATYAGLGGGPRPVVGFWGRERR